MEDYSQIVQLKHNERVIIVNDDGEFREPTVRKNNIPSGKQVFEPNGIFKKTYTKSWEYLKQELSPFEFRAAFSLALLAKANTNSLEPLNDETTLNDLIAVLDVSINKVKPVLKKLWDYGVYGKFEVAKQNEPYKKYWILNPYLSFSGKIINSDIANLFIGTSIEIAYHKEDNY